jgi:membrane protease YdiL (CAAX protease family)
MGFAILAVAAVLTTALALSPFLQNQEPPQRDLMNFVTDASSPRTLLPFFLLATVVAPLFEEMLFRGTLLPWLGHRLQKRLGPRWGWALALSLSALAFGAIHLEPVALPAISVLGFVLGLAFLRTGNLTASVLVHGIWNGSVLLFYRILMGS